MSLTKIIAAIFIVTSLFTSKSFTQNLNSIEGKVTDAKTGKPIEYATVFFSNTSIGVLTNKKGVYVIKNIPPGGYNLVCVIIGYGKVVQVVKITKGSDQKIDIVLDEKPITAKEISVVGESPAEWQRRLKKFTKEFLGERSNADDSKIINPEIIDFEIDKNNNKLVASAQDAIVIVNHALGYKIKAYLKDFVWSLSEEYGGFQIDLLFEELNSTDEKEKNNWQTNRLNVYKGSFRHFLKSCAEGNVYEEGFRLSKSHVTPELTYLNNSIYLLSQNKNEMDLFLNSIIKKNDEDIYCIVYDKLVQVVYLGAGEEPNYKVYMEKLTGKGSLRILSDINKYYAETNSYQNSWVIFPTGQLYFNNAGVCSDASPYGKKFAGYWAWKRVVDLLPYDYKLSLPN